MAVSEKTAQRHNRWKCQILKIIRTTPNASRIVVKRQTGLSMESILGLVDELLEEGLIRSRGVLEDGRVGRKATLLEINPDGCYFIGVRFSAGGIAGVCTNFEREVLYEYQREFVARPDVQTILEEIFACVSGLMERLGPRCERLRGIGVGAPGIIDLEHGVITRYVHIPGWKAIPLRGILTKRFGVPIYLEHGVKCTARALISQPPYTGIHELLFMQMGRGINLCMITGGRIVYGASYLSGEIGHMNVAGNDRLCECGRVGCLETLAASGALCAMAEEKVDTPPFAVLSGMLKGERPIHLRHLCTAANEGCEGCTALLSRAGQAIGEALAVSIMLANPGDVVLSGGLTASLAFREAVVDTLSRHCLPESLANAHLCFLPADARKDALGAAELPLQAQYGVVESGDPVQQALEASL